MQSMLLVLFTVACSLMMLDAAYLRAETKDTKAAAQQPNEDARIPYYVEQQYSPEVSRILSSPELMQELYDALEQVKQAEPEYKSAAPMKRAQTFVRFGKRAQTFVRFGK